MASGALTGLHYQTGKPVRVEWKMGRITRIVDVPPSGDPEPTMWIAPALFDIQINGYGGVDFQQDSLSEADLLRAVRALRRDGCTRILFTLITAEWRTLIGRLQRARAMRAASDELRSAIVGWHIEGPFLSDKPGFCGAHDPSVMFDPTPRHIAELRQATGDDPVLLTIAPERGGAIDAIQQATELGMRVSLGHTDASAEILRVAVNAGATGFTHLANGCPRELDRHDNIVWRVLETEGLTTSFIPDAIHVSSSPFRIMHRALGKRAMIYTTDAMAAAGASPGKFTIGNVQVEVGEDQIVRQPGKTNFAGSALRPKEGIVRAAKMLGTTWQACWDRMSTAPAKFMGVGALLKVGVRADLCILQETSAGLNLESVCVEGIESTAK